jgi:hypothetical protein
LAVPSTEVLKPAHLSFFNFSLNFKINNLHFSQGAIGEKGERGGKGGLGGEGGQGGFAGTLIFQGRTITDGNRQVKG